MEIDVMIKDLELAERRKKEYRDAVYTALQCEDIVKARMFFSLLYASEDEIIIMKREIEQQSSLN